jgi:hypothetical protein
MTRRARINVTVMAVVSLLVVLGWLHDFITLNGAKTVYTARCTGGEWRGAICTGTMRAGDRYRFHALKLHSEVIFWVSGAPEPSGKLAPCTIENAKQWTCSQGPDSSRTITHEMRFGHPMPEPRGPARAFHQVSKLKWLLLEQGLRLHEADT